MRRLAQPVASSRTARKAAVDAAARRPWPGTGTAREARRGMASRPAAKGIAWLAAALLAGCGAADGVTEPVAGVELPPCEPGAAGCGTVRVETGEDARVDGRGPADGPASVEGRWSGLDDLRSVGPVASRLVGCADGLRALERQPAAAAVPECAAVEPAAVVQSEATFTILRAPVACRDGIARTQSGGGAIEGDRLTGAVDLVGGDEVRTRYFTGSVDGDRLLLAFDRLEVQGLSSGTCLISPPQHAEVVVLP